MSKSWNWRLWVGFVLAFVATPFYFSFFDRVPWALWIAIVAFVIAIFLVAGGVRHAYAQPSRYRGKVAGPVVALLSLLFVGAFIFGTFMMTKAYSTAINAPRVGDKVPEFTVTDSSGHKVTVAQLLSSPLTGAMGRQQRGVLLVFYRGYW